MSSPHIVILGGGITGLSAAFALKQHASRTKQSIQCTVIERDARLGGKIRTFREDGLVMEGGPDSILARKQAGMELIRQLGLESEVVSSNPTAHKTYVLHKGQLERLPPGTNMGIPTQIAPFATTRLLSPIGKARALLDLVLPPDRTNEDVSLGRFLRHRLGNEVVDHVAEPLLAGIYAGGVDELSLEATFPQFRTLVQKHRSLILGSVAQKKQAKPSETHRSGRSVFVTLRTGLETIIERLYDELHAWADLQTSTTVSGIEKVEDRYVVSVSGPNGISEVEADAVIVAVPADVAGTLLSSVCEEAAELQNIPYVSTATVMLGYTPDSIEVDLDASGFVIPRGEQKHITACTWTSTKWPHTSSGNRVLIRCYVGRSGQEHGLKLTDNEIVQLVQLDLRDILGLTARPWFTRVTRWDNAMPQYRVGHQQLVSHVERCLEDSAPKIVLAGAGYRGVGIPDCIADANQAVERVIHYLNLGA